MANIRLSVMSTVIPNEDYGILSVPNLLRNFGSPPILNSSDIIISKFVLKNSKYYGVFESRVLLGLPGTFYGGMYAYTYFLYTPPSNPSFSMAGVTIPFPADVNPNCGIDIEFRYVNTERSLGNVLFPDISAGDWANGFFVWNTIWKPDPSSGYPPGGSSSGLLVLISPRSPVRGVSDIRIMGPNVSDTVTPKVFTPHY